MMPVSNDTLLQVVRRKGRPAPPAPNIIGIDDWAWKRNQRYGTIICDLERRRPIKLLPNREPATAQEWLAVQLQIVIVARDRGGGFALAASKALPGALQVADRWHLMENVSAAFLVALRKSMSGIRSALGAASVDPALLTAAEKLQYEGICGVKKPTPSFSRGPRVAPRSRRSCGRRGTAGVCYGKSCAVSARIFTARARVPSSRICPGLMRNGLPAVAMAPN
jgi:hypothetical protein